MVGHGGSSASSYLADPTSPIPSHCASTVMTSTVRVNKGSADKKHPACGQVFSDKDQEFEQAEVTQNNTDTEWSLVCTSAQG